MNMYIHTLDATYIVTLGIEAEARERVKPRNMSSWSFGLKTEQNGDELFGKSLTIYDNPNKELRTQSTSVLGLRSSHNDCNQQQ